ncbi:hypothetical protein SO802_009434 [Lithocarpus litseifolius]|uniref:Uncharacterized protein n=1 Tax=Lithocarpus litseifolius TaxID=425828 RepID=A0AAW2DBX7_9ROSI
MARWAPQMKMLKYSSIGGFVSHYGCSYVMESVKFGVPIIAIPMHLDQPVNARLVEGVGVGVEVKRDLNGRLEREEVAKMIREVVVDTNVERDVGDNEDSENEDEEEDDHDEEDNTRGNSPIVNVKNIHNA